MSNSDLEGSDRARPDGDRDHLTDAYLIRGMKRAEVDTAVDWAAHEGWNPGNCDAGVFYSTDPGGFLAGVLDGRMIGSISAVAYGEDFGFLGFYIVLPEFRGKGFGIQLWNAAIERLGERNIGLDGVLAQEKAYQRTGFTTAYHNIRFEYTPPSHFGGTVQKSSPATSSVERLQSDEGRLVSLSDVPFEEVLEYDSHIFPALRQKFLKGWINQPQGASLGLIKGGRLSGYGVIRACRTGFKIGPLFADDGEIAENLFNAMVRRASGGPIFLDVPEVNSAGMELARRHGMKKSFETVRMYNIESPDMPLDRVFGVTSFELG